MMRRLPALAFAALLLLAGCSRPPERNQEAARPARTAADPWVLAETDPRAVTPALMSNGLVGFRLDRSGSGRPGDSEALPLFLCDEYDPQGEEKIRQLPNALCWSVWIDGKRLDPADGAGYRQSLDMRTGVLETTWRAGTGSVKSRVALHPDQRLAGLQVSVDGFAGRPVSIQWQIAGGGFATSRLRPFPSPILLSSSGTLAWARHEVEGIVNPTTSDVPGGFVWKGAMPESGVASLSTLVGWSGGSLSRRSGKSGAAPGAQAGYQLADGSVQDRISAIERASKDHLSGADAPDIEIDGPVEDQMAVRSFLYYLRTAVHPGAGPVSPLNLSGRTYNGHVFWDADLWVFPALALLDPQAAATNPEYRWATREAWNRNYEPARASRQDVRWGDDPPSPLYKAAIAGGAKIGMTPWESSVTGLEVAPGDSRRQHHITGTAAYAASMASDLGLIETDRAKELVENAARFYAARARPRGDGTYGIEGVMSPDEFHIGDNDLFTNLIAQWCLDRSAFGRKVRPRLHLPKDATSFLTYDGDPVRTYKQAAAVLSIYPLQYAPAERQAAKMMERFADKVTKNGPAMSESIHATIWARLGQRKKAYDAWRRSWTEFTNHPLMLFSEKRSKDVTYFSTGAAGCLQTVLYGFAGIRLDDAKNPKAAWSVPLRNGRWLNVVPQLPPSWNSVELKHMTVLGKRYDLKVARDGVHATEGDS